MLSTNLSRFWSKSTFAGLASRAIINCWSTGALIAYLGSPHTYCSKILSSQNKRLEFLATKRKNINRMAAEQIISWDEFKELRA